MYALRLLKALGAVGATKRNLISLSQILPRGHQIEALETIERLGQVAATPEILNALESLASEADHEIKRLGASLKSMEDPGGYPWWATESSREAHGMTEIGLGLL